MHDNPAVPRGQPTDLFRLLVESVQDYAIFLLDPAGNVTSWNAGAQRIKGYSADEIIGKHFSIFYPAKEARRGFPAHELRVAAGEGRCEAEGWRVRKDGTRFWANVVITALYSDGALVAFAKVTRDLSERKRAEIERESLLRHERAARREDDAALERLRAIQTVTEAALSHFVLDDLLRTLLDMIGDILAVDTVVVLLTAGDGSGNLITRAAKGVDAVVEQGVSVPLGQGFAGRIAIERRPLAIEDVQNAPVVSPLFKKTGVQSLLGVPLIVAGGVLGVLHIGTLRQRHFVPADIQFLQVVADRVAVAIDRARLFETARSARADIEVAERMLRAQDEFLTVAAHELKTPLTSARLASQILLRQSARGDTPDTQDLRWVIEMIDAQLGKLSRIVTDVVASTEKHSSAFVLDRADTDIVALVEQVAARARLHDGTHEIAVLASGPLRARVDAARLQQVVTSLLDNAMKFSPNGRRIEIAVAAQTAATFQMEVRDHGPGVPLEQRARLFERFFRAHVDKYQSGLGLGLSTSREIVSRHGGTIVANFPPEGGMHVIVTLPIDPPATAVDVGPPTA